MMEPGTPVIVLEDCRREGQASGMLGTYLGRFRHTDGKPSELGSPKIHLANGTTIYGFQCWWQEAAKVPSLEAAQIALETFKAALREDWAKVIASLPKDSGELAQMIQEPMDQVEAALTQITKGVECNSQALQGNIAESLQGPWDQEEPGE